MTLAARIARNESEKYKALHPLGPILWQSLKVVVQNVAKDCREISLGRRQALPENGVAEIVCTLGRIMDTHAALLTLPRVSPVALCVVPADSAEGSGLFKLSQ